MTLSKKSTTPEPLIFLIAEDFDVSTRGFGDHVGGVNGRLVQLPADALTKGLRSFASSLGAILGAIEEAKDGFQLDEVNVNVEISASGQFALLGSGAAAGGKAGVQLKYKRKPIPAA